MILKGKNIKKMSLQNLPLELIAIISNNIEIQSLMKICGLTDDYICFAEFPPENPLVIFNKEKIREYWRGKNRYIFMNLACENFERKINEGQCRLLNNILRDFNYDGTPSDFKYRPYRIVNHPIDTMIENLWARREVHEKLDKKDESFTYVYTEFECQLCKYSFNIKIEGGNKDKSHIRKPYGWRMNDAGYLLSKIEAEIYDKKIQHFDSCHNNIPDDWENDWRDTLAEKMRKNRVSGNTIEDALKEIGIKEGVNFLDCKRCGWRLPKYHYTISHDVYHWMKTGEKSEFENFDQDGSCKGCKWNKNHDYNLLHNLYDLAIMNQLELIKKTHRRICGIQINTSFI